MTREDTLNAAKAAVCGDRDHQYGSPERNFSKIAEFWSDYLEYNITAHDVAVMMVLFKVARVQSGQHKADNYIDLAGYAVCGCEIVTEEGSTDGIEDY